MDKKYDFSKFSKEDSLLYKDILEGLPYSEKLEALFIDSNKLENRLAKSDERHLSRYAYADAAADRQRRDETEERDIRLLLEVAMGSLSAVQRRRLKAYFYYGLTQREIADMEGVGYGAVEHSLKIALKRLKQSID